MRSITIRGVFTDSINNLAVLDVFRPNSLQFPYDFRKTFTDDFAETLVDLQDDLDYVIDYTGFTTGQFDLEITGEFLDPNPITDTIQNDSFNRGVVIHTNP